MNKLPKYDNYDDDEKNKKEIIPLLLPNCPDIKAFIKSIESPRVLLEFLKEDYETIYELANYGNEPPFSKLIHEAAGRIWEMGLKKSFKLPVEPVSNDMRVYKTWCRTCIDCINSIKNAESELLTVSQIADELWKPLAKINYIISKYRIKPIERVGVCRRFNRSQIEIIKRGLK